MSSGDHGKIPPQASELEKAVLGGVLLEKKAMGRVCAFLSAEMFYVDSHQRIFAALMTLFQDGYPIDILTVTERLRSRGELDVVGGAFYISALANGISSTANLEYHARIVKEKYLKRELIRVGDQTVRDAYDETVDVFDLMDKSASDLNEVFMRSESGMMEFENDVVKSFDVDSGVVVSTGWKEMDKKFGGYVRGKMATFAMASGGGKTVFMVNSAWKMSEFGPGILFSIEMSREEIHHRLACSVLGLDIRKATNGDLSPDEIVRVQSWQSENKERIDNIVIDHTEDLNWSMLRAKMEVAVNRKGVQWAFVDYLQIVEPDTEFRKLDEGAIVTKSSKLIRKLSAKYMIPVIVLSQLTIPKEREGQMPRVSDIRWSKQLENDSAKVMLGFRPGYAKARPPLSDWFDVKFGKNRHGDLGTIRFKWFGPYGQIGDMVSAAEWRAPGKGDDDERRWVDGDDGRRELPVEKDDPPF